MASTEASWNYLPPEIREDILTCLLLTLPTQIDIPASAILPPHYLPAHYNASNCLGFETRWKSFRTIPEPTTFVATVKRLAQVSKAFRADLLVPLERCGRRLQALKGLWQTIDEQLNATALRVEPLACGQFARAFERGRVQHMFQSFAEAFYRCRKGRVRFNYTCKEVHLTEVEVYSISFDVERLLCLLKGLPVAGLDQEWPRELKLKERSAKDLYQRVVSRNE